MFQSHYKGRSLATFTLVVSLAMFASKIYAQYVPGIVGKNSIAITVSNADSTSTWYENVFGIKLLKEIKTPDGSAHIRIEGNEFLMVEILQVKGSRKINDCNLSKEEVHLLEGYFKFGMFVKSAAKAEQYFKSRGIPIRHALFHDKETATSSFILEDPNGNMLQFIEDLNSKGK